MVNQVRGPRPTSPGNDTTDDGVNGPRPQPDETAPFLDRRSTLLEKADTDPEEGNDDEEHLFSTEEYNEMIEKHPTDLLREIRELLRQQRGLNTAHVDMEDRIARKDRLIAEMTEERAAGRAAGRSTSPEGEPIKLAKIVDPPFFSNTPSADKLDFDGWLNQVKNKLLLDVRQYPTEARKIVYVSGLLRSPAYNLISPRLDPQHSQKYTRIEELYHHMTELWSNPNKQRDARTKFRSITMGKSEKFQDFYATFTKLVADGHIAEQDLKDDLNTKLWWKLQEAVAVYFNDDNYNLHQFANMCAINDRQIRERLDKIPTNSGKQKEKSITTTSRDSGSKEVPKVSHDNYIKEARAGNPRADSSGDKPNNITCYNCGEPGHIARRCPKPVSEKRKRYLSFMEKELELAKAEAVGDSGKDQL